MKTSPQRRSKTPSPIKVKDYFTNPLHKIKQPAFTEVGFTSSALNTFVKNFTNRQNSKYISLASIRSFIKSFTNNNPKLMQMYEDFFIRNFVQKQQGLIQIDQFMEFFIHEDKRQEISIKNLKMIYKELTPLNTEALLERAQSLQISINSQQAAKIIQMINHRCDTKDSKNISEQNFLKVLRE